MLSPEQADCALDQQAAVNVPLGKLQPSDIGRRIEATFKKRERSSHLPPLIPGLLQPRIPLSGQWLGPAELQGMTFTQVEVSGRHPCKSQSAWPGAQTQRCLPATSARPFGEKSYQVLSSFNMFSFWSPCCVPSTWLHGVTEKER